MVPPVQHLHGEPVTLGDPGDEDLVRSRLCHAQSPSRKVGRVDTADGSTGGAKLFNIPQSYGRLCDPPHIRAFFSSHPRRSAATIQIGNIILRYFPAECLSGTGGPASSGSHSSFARQQSCPTYVAPSATLARPHRSGCLIPGKISSAGPSPCSVLHGSDSVSKGYQT